MSKQRNVNSHRLTEANKERTEQVKDAYYKKRLLLSCWESMPMALQCKEHEYILTLKARIRNLKNYLSHRATPDSDL